MFCHTHGLNESARRHYLGSRSLEPPLYSPHSWLCVPSIKPFPSALPFCSFSSIALPLPCPATYSFPLYRPLFRPLAPIPHMLLPLLLVMLQPLMLTPCPPFPLCSSLCVLSPSTTVSTTATILTTAAAAGPGECCGGRGEVVSAVVLLLLLIRYPRCFPLSECPHSLSHPSTSFRKAHAPT